MDEEGILGSNISPELTDCLQKRQTLDVSDRAPDLCNNNVHIVRQIKYLLLDFIGDMGNYLNGPAKIITSPFPCNHGIIDLSRGEVIPLPHDSMGIAFVVPKIEIRFSAVISDKHLAVLEGIHCSWIDVDVRIEFKHVDRKTSVFHEGGDRGRGESFSQG